MPISLRLFQEFWQKRVINQRDSYPFQQFLKHVLIDLVSNVFTNRCAVDGENLNSVRGSYDHITLDKESPQKVDFTARKQAGSRDECWKQVRRRPTRMNRTRDMLYVYTRTNELVGFKGNKTDDNNKGILHIDVGDTGTAITNISFSKADVPLYLEAKGERAGLSGNPLELSEPYNVSFTTMGTNVFKPGRHFYLTLPHFGPPLSDARSAARILGLGGYFMVTKVNNSLSVDGSRIDWYSDVDALWVSFAKYRPTTGDTSADQPDVEDATVGAFDSRVSNVAASIPTEKKEKEKLDQEIDRARHDDSPLGRGAKKASKTMGEALQEILDFDPSGGGSGGY